VRSARENRYRPSEPAAATTPTKSTISGPSRPPTRPQRTSNIVYHLVGLWSEKKAGPAIDAAKAARKKPARPSSWAPMRKNRRQPGAPSSGRLKIASGVPQRPRNQLDPYNPLSARPPPGNGVATRWSCAPPQADLATGNFCIIPSWCRMMVPTAKMFRHRGACPPLSCLGLGRGPAAADG